ncbi:hypothetical protein BD410DRAFT_782614 [Rickenella mellea]|uniref:MIT domain-containing protein n=1 Tax=Rickenella mellea TaxID=50990 RepID=A0A4Y7QKT7_9AGAM|nr:hypothetical protein BD410DRAFT_782614 [Rickenella mellea]
MSASESPLNQAHQHAHNADDYQSRGLLIPAAEEHYKAAEFYQLCVEQCQDENTKRTLRMLYADNSKAGKDLQRRIAKMREEGKDPSLPQLSPASQAPSSGRAVEAGRHTSLVSSPRSRMLDSPSNTVDESFMVLNQQSVASDDPFDLFWKVTAEMMENLSQPISFPNAALAAFEAAETTTINAQQPDIKHSDPNVNGSHTLLAASKNINRESSSVKFDADEPSDEDYDSSDSFCLVPTSQDKESSSRRLRKENAILKAQLEDVQKQVASVRKQMAIRQEQDLQLREHIAVARKEAHRAMVSSTSMAPRQGQPILEFASLNVNMNPPPQAMIGGHSGGRERESQLLRRIRELEDEVRTTRLENDKQKAMITKFRERWERLKESAKRKRSAKAAAQAETSSVRERIDEDPEAEEEADELSKDGS